MIVSATVTPIPGAFHYEVSVTNTELVDLWLVSITDAPLVAPLIGETLVVPAGFIGVYDPPSGISTSRAMRMSSRPA